jgi:serine/threonine-protein kinase
MKTNDEGAAARSNRWARAKDIFGDLIALPAHERALVLDERCGDDVELKRFVESLLAADENFVETRDDPMLRDIGVTLDRLVNDIARGRRFGAFEAVEEIGRGGMGAVWLAERHDGKVAQRVALKLVAYGHLDAEASARLARERRLLATLEHPNIARLIDAGEDPSGIPWFAMEYVKGLPITRWCNERALPVADRLRLFRLVCAAVQYAHANLVVHCDLKASNILVTDDGQPKLLDFGIATTLGADAVADESRFLSPASAAPEQFLGQPTGIATDVYALGVLLCELAGGRLPFDGNGATLREAVLHAQPRLPGEAQPALRRPLRGDIDAIVAKALKKAPHDRYASVAELDADVARHLATRPIAIRAHERGYRAWTFVRRNVLGVSLTAVLAAVVIGFAVTTLRQNERLAHERDQAQLERARAEQVTEFVVGLFKAAKPEETLGREVTARQLLERGRQQLGGSLARQPFEESLVQQPQLKAAMLVAIAEASYSLDDLQGSYLAAREALNLLDSSRSQSKHDFAIALAALIRIENEFGYREDAQAHEDRALALAGEMDVGWRVELALERASTQMSFGKARSAELILREALALQENEHGRDRMRLARVAIRLAVHLQGNGSSEEANRVLRTYLPNGTDGLETDNPRFGDVLVGMAIYSRNKDDHAKASEYAEKAVLFNSRVYGEVSSRTATAKNTWATILNRMGNNDRSVELLKEALTAWRATHSETSKLARFEHNVGAVLADMGRVEDALDYLQRAVSIGKRTLAPNHRVLAFFRRQLGWVLSMAGRDDEAESELHLALSAFEAEGMEDHMKIIRADLACISFRRDRSMQRKNDLEAALARFEKSDDDKMHFNFLHECLLGVQTP